MRRSVGEWAGLAVAFVVAGVLVAFCVVLIASFLSIPPVGTGVLVAIALVALVYPIFRTSPAPAPAVPAPAVTRERTVMSDAPLVGIIVGSQSDMAVMDECARTLESFGIPYELLIGSAHRQPEKVREWASGLAARGAKVVIAAAGKAAHLGGVVAAYTPLPVIAVPMKTSDLGGLDSLLSMVQMPSGVPVACVAINGAKNAAILATQMLGTSMPEYRTAIERMKIDLAQ
jgi:5-(carboxyamino)imidazole ribonucleotide mutase